MAGKPWKTYHGFDDFPATKLPCLMTLFGVDSGRSKHSKAMVKQNLVGGLQHQFYDFPFSWECHHPN
jgi:hypothetical protein